MATILDIFRTYAGEKLMERCTAEIGKLETKDVQRAFSFLFPAVLVSFQTKKSLTPTEPGKLIQFIEKGHFISAGKKIFSADLTEKDFEILHSGASLTGINEQDFHNLLYTSAAVLSCIIHEIKATEKDAGNDAIIQSLLGLDVRYNRAFIKSLIKNEEDAHLIDNSEKIALDPGNDKDDQSILGGYTGGR